MLRTLATRLGLIRDPGQLELGFDRAALVLARLRKFGLHSVQSVTLTRNRSVYVSCRGPELRVHEAFADAPDDIQRAIVTFVTGRAAARRAARKQILEYPIPRSERRKKTREVTHADDRQLADRLSAEHVRLNTERFGGTLQPIRICVSRRMRSRLGHYAPAASHGKAGITISRRHARRHAWDEVLETLLHEMVHQWQEESGHAVDHSRTFRQKASELGIEPRAKRAVTPAR